MIRLVLSSVFLLAMLASCTNPETEKAQKPQVKKEQQKAAKAKKKKPSSNRLIPRGGAPKFLKEYAQKDGANIVVIHTRLGDMKIRLYPKTPMHRANFVYLARNGFFDQTLFYRIEKGFMIQGGGTDDEDVVNKRNQLGKYKVPAEIIPEYFHKRGALAMARSYTDNPERESSEFNFYIVQGEKYSDGQINTLENDHGVKIPSAHRKVYQSRGGAPHIDGEHTVFGEVIEGLDVIDKIAALEVDDGGWPYEDVPISVTVPE